MNRDDESVGQADHHGRLVGELNEVRIKGLLRLRGLALPVLTGLAERRPGGRAVSAEDVEPTDIERVIHAVVTRLDGERLRAAALSTFGLAPDTRDLSAKQRRDLAAEVFGLTADHFRKNQEKHLLEEVAGALLAFDGSRSGASTGYQPDGDLRQGGGAALPDGGPDPGPPSVAPTLPDRSTASRLVHAGRHTATVPLGHRTVELTLHVGPIQFLCDIDVLVSPENIFFEMSKTFRPTVSGSLRWAGARKDAVGAILDDLIAGQLHAWLSRNGTPGLPVAPGTVAPTSAGELAGRGIRRIYHAAVATPLVGTDRYDTTPGAVSEAVRRVFQLARWERRSEKAALRSVALPLLGAGRGGLDPRISLEAILIALEHVLAADPDWAVHLVTHDAGTARLVLDALTDRRGHVCCHPAY
ncbi:hypothetical protein C6Y14_38400 [Streptomyces dioscori]|uniref:Macro domain-containing protein n=1 Tax=Streptomyces dioscori TaxID=2109333 RepID=A0A2P8PW34_9ACTN|nr:macro domain-containing protein [Streptomyces dioscori]PSM38212.1 hypothetical protein C6Y14_38400 [Streptomyces dioscori]